MVTTPTPTLAERVVACAGFRWLPGMLVTCSDGRPALRLVVEAVAHVWWGGDEFAEFAAYCLQGGHDTRLQRDAYQTIGTVPDLTDPATLGCLLSLVREAFGPRLCVGIEDESIPPLWSWDDGGLSNDMDGDTFWATYDSEAEALVAALEAAP